MTARTCPYCNASVSPQECADGWCEGCGKRLPPSFRVTSPGPPPETDRTGPEFDGWALVAVLILIVPGFGVGAGIGYIVAVLVDGNPDWWCLGGGFVGALLGVGLGFLSLFLRAEGRAGTILLTVVGAVYVAPIVAGSALTVAVSLGASPRGAAITLAVGLLLGGLYGALAARSKDEDEDEPAPPGGTAQ